MALKKPELKAVGISGAKCSECLIYKQLSENTNRKNPVFSFKYLQKGYDLKECTKEDKVALLDQIGILSQLTWQDIFNNGRHSTGQEKISRNSIIPAIPACVKDDTTLISLRYKGKAPVIGFRENEVFHILWIDSKFNVYKH